VARSKYTEVELGMIADISVNLKQILHLKGVSQTDLSNKTKLPTSTISDYVNGKTLIPPGNLQKIADSLNVLKSDINSSFKKTLSPLSTESVLVKDYWLSRMLRAISIIHSKIVVNQTMP